jgi:hypothetical protein
MSGFSNKPKISKGAFVEYGLSLPPLFVVFQFNPTELSRNRSLTFTAPNEVEPNDSDQMSSSRTATSLRQFHQNNYLTDIQSNQMVTVGEESVTFDIRLDATDKMDEDDVTARSYGIAPQLSTLELMVHPKDESLLGSLLGSSSGFSFTKGSNPPMVLFIWGAQRVLPVNIISLNIKETEFSTALNPIRAEVSVNLTIVEGKNTSYQYTKLMKETMSLLNLADVTDIANVAIPG